MRTASVIAGRAEAGAMVWRPAPGMAKTMVSGPGFVLASRMAWRREPRPESKLLTTVSVDARALVAARIVTKNKPQAASAVRVREPSMKCLLQPSCTGRCTETMGKGGGDYHPWWE